MFCIFSFNFFQFYSRTSMINPEYSKLIEYCAAPPEKWLENAFEVWKENQNSIFKFEFLKLFFLFKGRIATLLHMFGVAFVRSWDLGSKKIDVFKTLNRNRPGSSPFNWRFNNNKVFLLNKLKFQLKLQ